LYQISKKNRKKYIFFTNLLIKQHFYELNFSSGLDGYNTLGSQETYQTNGWIMTNNLPIKVSGHSIVDYNATHVMQIGGYDGSEELKDVYFLNVAAQQWTRGPNLNIPRSGHSCSRIKKEQSAEEEVIICVGGFYNDLLSSVEIFNPDDFYWKKGPSLPIPISHAQLVWDPSGGIILVGGESNSNYYLNTLYRLPHAEGEWELMPQKLTIGRLSHVAFLVPDEITNCTLRN